MSRTVFTPGDEGVNPYALLTSLVVPRAIAWVSTVGPDGRGNLAPHSFFTVASNRPPTVLFCSLGRKDTVLIWPGESVRIAIDFSLPASPAFAANQVFMFHCHNLEHEDGGMMVGVRVA